MNKNLAEATRAYLDRPISGDKRYKNRDEEAKILAEILEGTRQPETDFERNYLNYLNGPRPKATWPQEWRTCLRCGVEWKVTAFPGPDNSWLFATICRPCDDILKAQPGFGPAPESEKPKDDQWIPFKD